jgi:hypothetical protein
MRVLRTLKGSKIERYLGVVGKRMGSWLYVHRDYVDRLPTDFRIKVDRAIGEPQGWPQVYTRGFEYNTLKISTDSNTVVFMHSPDFDTAAEPVAGNWCRVDPDAGELKVGHTSNIWHHKWLWVMDDYDGFDVDASFQRSQDWLELEGVDMFRIGNPKYWDTIKERI